MSPLQVIQWLKIHAQTVREQWHHVEDARRHRKENRRLQVEQRRSLQKKSRRTLLDVDGGMVKTVVVEGRPDGRKPRQGDIVTYHITERSAAPCDDSLSSGCLNGRCANTGKLFDSSRGGMRTFQRAVNGTPNATERGISDVEDWHEVAPCPC